MENSDSDSISGVTMKFVMDLTLDASVSVIPFERLWEAAKINMPYHRVLKLGNSCVIGVTCQTLAVWLFTPEGGS